MGRVRSFYSASGLWSCGQTPKQPCVVLVLPLINERSAFNNILQWLALVFFSRDPQPCDDGCAPVVPWRHHHRSVCFLSLFVMTNQSNFIAVVKSDVTPFSFA